MWVTRIKKFYYKPLQNLMIYNYGTYYLKIFLS
jgi:hypothetical protein